MGEVVEPLPADERFEALFRTHVGPLLGYALRRVAQPRGGLIVEPM